MNIIRNKQGPVELIIVVTVMVFAMAFIGQNTEPTGLITGDTKINGEITKAEETPEISTLRTIEKEMKYFPDRYRFDSKESFKIAGIEALYRTLVKEGKGNTISKEEIEGIREGDLIKIGTNIMHLKYLKEFKRKEGQLIVKEGTKTYDAIMNVISAYKQTVVSIKILKIKDDLTTIKIGKEIIKIISDAPNKIDLNKDKETDLWISYHNNNNTLKIIQKIVNIKFYNKKAYEKLIEDNASEKKDELEEETKKPIEEKTSTRKEKKREGIRGYLFVAMILIIGYILSNKLSKIIYRHLVIGKMKNNNKKEKIKKEKRDKNHKKTTKQKNKP